MKKGTKGFTLIELLVVIAIIAILSTVVMAGLNSARTKGRDAKRIADIKQLQAALELYFDTCGGYPSTFTMPTTAALALSVPDTISTPSCPSGTTLSTFMDPLPLNPTPGGANYTYTGTSNSTYALTFTLEGTSGALGSGAHTASPSGLQ